MTNRINLLMEKARQATEADPQSLLVVVKEMLHQDILASIAESPLTKKLVFQGGTSLRLCHQNPRYSEDLDFARRKTADGPAELDDEDFDAFQHILERTMRTRYDLDIEIKPPKQPISQRSAAGRIEVHRWIAKVKVQSPMDGSVQRIHIEVADVPAYDPVLLPVGNYHDVGGSAPYYLNVSSMNEILCDKIIAVAGREYLKPRDIWDLQFLTSKRVSLHRPWVLQKARDYHMDTTDDYPNLISRLNQRIIDMQQPAFVDQFVQEMSRFLYGTAGVRLREDPEFAPQLIRQVSRYLEVVSGQLLTPEPAARSGFEP